MTAAGEVVTEVLSAPPTPHLSPTLPFPPAESQPHPERRPVKPVMRTRTRHARIGDPANWRNENTAEPLAAPQNKIESSGAIGVSQRMFAF